MDDKALQVSYELFKAKGYNGTIEDYSALIKENEEALNVSHQLFSQNGYSGSIEDFSNLVGLEKTQGPAKDAAVVGPMKAVDSDLTSSDGSLEFLNLSDTFSGNLPTPVQEIINSFDIEAEKENIDFQIDKEWVEESLLPTKEEYTFDRASGVGKRTKKTEYPLGYKEYLNKANGDLEAAKELYKKDRKSDIVKNKLSEYFKDKISGSFSYDEGILEDQEKLSKQKLASIEESLEINKKSTEELSGNIANVVSKIKDIDNVVKGVTNLTKEEFDSFKKQRDSYLADINAMVELQSDIHSKSLELASEYEDESKILDVVKRDYGQLTNLFGNIGAGFLETGASLMEYPKMFGTLLLSEMSGLDKPTSDAVLTAVVPAFKSAESVMTKAENIKEGLVAPVSVSDINSLTDFGYWAGQVTGNVAPQVALSVATGGSTLMPSLFMGVSAAGMKYNDMMKESLVNGIEYSGLQILAATNLSGAAEALSERITFGQMKGITSILRKNPTALKAANEYIAKNIAKGRYFTTTAAESASEVAAQLANNFIDIEILGKEDVKITDGLLDSAAAGAFMSGVIFKAPAVGRKLLFSTASQETLKQLKSNSDQVLELTKELNKLEKNGADEKIVQSVKNSIATITSNSSKLIAKNYDRWSYLNKDEKASYIKLKENLDDIKVQAMLVRDSDIGEDAKKATIENLNKEYTKSLKELKNIDDIAGQRLDPVKADPEYRERLEKDQIANIRSIMKENGVDQDRLVEYSSKEKPSNWDDLSSALQANIEGSMGTFHDGVMYINKDKTKEQGYFTTGQHEFLHLGLFLAFNKNQDMMNKAGEMLYNHLEAELGGSLYGTEFYKRFSGYSGKVEQWEEVMTLLSESLSRGDIKKTKSLAQRLSDWFKTLFSQTFGYQIEFKDGADVFRFVENFNKDIEKGRASKGLSKILQRKATINIKGEKQAQEGTSLKTKASKAIEDKMFALEDKLNTGEISMDQYDEEMDRLISELEKQEQKIEEVEDFEVKKTPAKKKREKSELEIELAGKAKKHKEILDGIGNNPDGYNPNDPKLWDTLESMITSKARNFTTAKGDYAPLTNLPGFDMESMVAETQANMINYIKKFDPSLNNSLYGYINAQLQNRMRAALKTGRVAGAEFTTDVTEAKGVVADEGGYVEVAKPDYTSISDSKAFSSELIEKSKNELLRVVRVLKSKIDAPMTVNQSISPLMRELIQGTKNMMDAAIKVEMGGKKDGKLRKWLQANKKTVIENSTTTFLMGKDAKTTVKGGIPQAIQKQINGEWVSYPEWVGKTPDRETTWARGNTSGNYIVRRVPANQVSEADFLSQVLNPNGNPIPGRKEAIAMHLSSELSVELFIKELKDENSDISKAFETNRELRDEILADNFISEVNKQAERGLMKQSMVGSIEDTNALFDALKANDMLSKAGETAFDSMIKDEKEYNIVAILKTLIAEENLNKDIKKKDIAGIIIKNAKGLISPETAKEFFEAANEVVEYYKYQKAIVNINNLVENIVKLDEADIDTALAYFFNLQNRGARNLYRYGFRTNELMYHYIDAKLVREGKQPLAERGFELEELKGFRAKIVKFNDRIDFNYTEVTLSAIEKATSIDEINKIIDEYNQGYSVLLEPTIDYIVENQNNKNLEGLLQIMRVHMDSPLRRVIRISFVQKGIENLKGITLEHGDKVADITDKILQASKTKSKEDFRNFLKTLFTNSEAGVISKELEKKLPKDGSFKQRYKSFNNSIVNVEGKKLILETPRIKSTIKSSRPITQNMSEADINKEFNKMLERKSGIKAGKKISESAAARLGKYKGKFKFFLPPNAEDFIGLLYPFLGKGKQGDTDFQFFKELLIDPFNEAEQRMSEFRQDLSKDIKSINKEIGKISTIVDKKTVKELDKLGYSPEQAVRIYIWSRRGEDIPDITRVERTKVNLILAKDRKLANYANHVMKITEKYGGYPPPSDHWFAGNLTTDFYEYANNNVRQGLLETWQGNIDILFNVENLSKLRAIYGKDFVKNLELTIQRMKSGVNKFHSQSKLAQSAIDYINGSVGVIMFLNMRSAVLQTISAINFINWTDNNPIAAVKALSNPKEYARMFLNLINSDFLKQRRAGLELNISEAEIADAATNAKNLFSRLYHKAIKVGYKPTQFADSFAIAFGGTSFIMNRIKTYEKEGFSQSEAYEKAYNDFREIAEENQQSSRTDKISNIQSSDLLGRTVFSFNNTPFQYARIVKKATLDLANGRGDWKTNLSKILYYGAVQNALFYTLQQALFRTMFDEDEEEVTKTELKLLNNMADSLLRGSGLPGAIISMIKNVIIKAKEEEKKGWKMSPEKIALELTSISPPISYKLKKFSSSIRSYKYAETDYDKIRAAARMGSVVNLPADRLLTKYENLTTAMSNDIDNWMRFALLAGWGKYELGLYDKDKKKAKKTNNAIKTLKIKPIKIKPIKVK